MTSYKLCLTFLVIVSVSLSVTANALYDSASNHRIRRSSDVKDQSAEATTEEADHHGFQAGYRFGEEFFLPEASKSIPAEYKKKADGCERVVKNSMVCMVCKDPKTNAKYEQCSYVGNPPPKAPSPARTSKKDDVSYAPESSSESSESAPPRGAYQTYESPAPSRGASSYESTSSPRSSNYDSSSSPRDYSVYDTSSAPRDSGENYESSAPSRGSHENYESSTPSRGSHENYESSTPSRGSHENYESSTPSRGSHENYESSTPSRGSHENYEASKPEATGYSYKDYAPAPYSYSESSKEDSDSAEDPAASSDCRQIEKDSQTCRICKDPKTGKDFERCSSSYKPDDKTYAYGKSEKYGYPESQEDDKDEKADFRTFENNPDEYKSESSEDPAETSDCRQVKKDDQTCTICKDPKTGGDSERCSSSYRPADKSYAFGTSEKFGGPSPQGKDDYKSYNEDNDDKSADASYDSPSEYHSGYPKSSDDSYNKYHSDLPEEYSQSSYDGGSGYHGSSPNYGGSEGAEYAAPSVPAETKKASGNGGAQGCREIQKDSMTCTVCTDPKTGGNFEKCSYAFQPDDKVYKFTKSKTFGYPEAGEGSKNRGEGRRGGRGDATRESESKQVLDTVKINGCKQIQKGSMICTVCTDPKTSVSSEQCAYGTIPSEKLFSYLASKSVGSPRKEGAANSGKKSDQEGHQESRQVPRWSGEEIRQFVAESKQVADAVEKSPCRKIEKDSMTCTVCKDPKTGASSEQCSYSSKPKENLYTYSKSKSSGRPRKGGNGNGREKDEKNEEETRENKEVQTAESASPCRKIEKDSMTCTVCKDPKTGENSEQCAYSYKPKERHFTYTKSKSFGNPRKEEKKGKGTQDEKPEESHHVSRWSNDGDDYYAKVHRPRGFSKPDWSYRE